MRVACSNHHSIEAGLDIKPAVDNGDVAIFQVDASNMLLRSISVVPKSTSYRFVVHLKLQEKKRRNSHRPFCRKYTST